MTPASPRRWSSWPVDLGCLAVLLGLCWRLLHGLDGSLDLTLWDEADYLRRGLTLSWSHLPAAEWGPLYSLWYTALSVRWPDPVALHFANLQVLCVLTTVGAYVFPRRMGARPLLALLGAAVYLLSSAPFVPIRPTLLALLVLEVALIGASFLESSEGFWATLAGGLLLASFARPELFVAFGLATVLFLVSLVRGLRRERGTWRGWRGALASWSVLGAVLLLQVLGNPFGDTRHRRFDAFCQHFAVNHVRHIRSPVDPWNECPRVLGSVFGDVHTVGEAVRANPGAFLWHVGVNVKAFAASSVSLFLGEPGSVETPGPWSAARICRLLVLGLVGTLAVSLLWRRGRSVWAEPALQRMAGVLLLVEVPTLTSAVLLMPRAHYLVLQGVFILALLVLLGSREASPSRAVEGLVGAGLVLGLAALTPGFSHRPASQVHLGRVRALAALHLDAGVAPDAQLPLLEAHGGYDAYLGPRYYPVLRQTPGLSLDALLREREVGAILLDEALRGHPRFLHDAQLQALAASPEAFGFIRVPLAAPGEVLLVRASGRLGWSRVELERR